MGGEQAMSQSLVVLMFTEPLMCARGVRPWVKSCGGIRKGGEDQSVATDLPGGPGLAVEKTVDL